MSQQMSSVVALLEDIHAMMNSEEQWEEVYEEFTARTRTEQEKSVYTVLSDLRDELRADGKLGGHTIRVPSVRLGDSVRYPVFGGTSYKVAVLERITGTSEPDIVRFILDNGDELLLHTSEHIWVRERPEVSADGD